MAVTGRQNFTVADSSWNDDDDDDYFDDDGQTSSIGNNNNETNTFSIGKIFNIFQSVSELIEPDESLSSSLESSPSTIITVATENRHHHRQRMFSTSTTTTTTSTMATPTMASKPETPTRRLFDINRVLFRESSSPRPSITTSRPSSNNIPEIIFFDVNSSEISETSVSPSPVDIVVANLTTTTTTTTSTTPTGGGDIFWPPLTTIANNNNNNNITTAIPTTVYIEPPSIIVDQTSSNTPDWFYYHPDCLHSPEEYELFTSMLCSSLAVLGVVYFLYGYRCFRVLSFFIGMVFGTVLFYTICIAEHLPDLIPTVPGGNLLPALISGLVMGLLAMLVAYIGLFVTGLHLGLMLGIKLLFVIYLLRPYHLILQAPLSSLTVLIFFVAFALVGALTTVYFSKGCTIIASSMYGSALTLLCVDYFLEDFKLAHWFLASLSQGDQWYGLLSGIKRQQRLCIVSHVMLAMWPLLTMFGMIIQGCFTAKNVQYRNGYGMVDTIGTASSRHRHHQPFRESHSLRSHHGISGESGNGSISGGSSVRSASNQDETRLEQRHRKYRYLYQVRTAHGDVISQHYLQSLQNKGKNPNTNNQLCLPDQDSFTFNSDLSSHFFPSESRTTTLSVA